MSHILFSPSVQEILRTLKYISSAAEPSLSLRLLSISLTSLTETQTCSISINIAAVNDHYPVVDLSGPLSSSVNFSISLNYTIFSSNIAAVASSAVVISDGDSGAVVESVMVELVSGREGDRLQLSESICSDSDQSTCHLRHT